MDRKVALNVLHGKLTFTTAQEDPREVLAQGLKQSENQVIQVFENSEFGQVEVRIINNEPYFAATECATILGHTNPQRAIRTFCRGVTEIVTPIYGNLQAKNYIPEADLYRLIFRSTIPSAERFTDWVTEEVLPSIRKHGAYLTNRLLQAAQADIKVLSNIISRMKEEYEEFIERVEATEYMEDTEESIPIEDFAEILTRNGIRMETEELYTWLYEHKFLLKNNWPMKRHQDCFIQGEIFELRRPVPYTTINMKGVVYISRLLMEYFNIPEKFREKALKSIAAGTRVSYL